MSAATSTVPGVTAITYTLVPDAVTGISYMSTPDPIASVTTFAAGVAHERGRNIAQNTRRSPVARERALLAEGMRLLAVGPFGARQAAWLLAGYVAGVSTKDADR